ncbi:MAG: hypothetical protein ABH824_00240 [Nanoarchaeota archaeon]|nr:hypothetical protein [Nanoarchaeota archaeon]
MLDLFSLLFPKDAKNVLVTRDYTFLRDLNIETLVKKEFSFPGIVDDWQDLSYNCLGLVRADSSAKESEELSDLITKEDVQRPMGMIFADLTTDLRTLTYRQQVMAEIYDNPEIQEKVLRTVAMITTSYKKYRMEHLHNYKGLVENFPDFSDARSEGLRNLTGFIEEIKQSDKYQGMCEFLDFMNNKLEGGVFMVRYDKKGWPASISTVELVRKDAEQPLESVYARIIGQEEFAKVQEDNGKRQLQGEAECGGFDHGRPFLRGLGEVLHTVIESEINKVADRVSSQQHDLKRIGKELAFYIGFARFFKGLEKKGLNITMPSLLPMDERQMHIKGAYNPLINEVKQDEPAVVVNDINHDPNQNMFVITGPNQGGKTTYVKTLGLIQVLAQAGLYVPASEAEISVVDGIYTHFISPDDITKGEGRLKNEFRRMAEILLNNATPYSLVILDEPTGGTSYEEGGEEALKILIGLHKNATATYMTTHIHPITEQVRNEVLPCARNLQVSFIEDRNRIIYTHKIIPGSSGKSFAGHVARETGLTEENIQSSIKVRAQKGGYSDLLRD